MKISVFPGENTKYLFSSIALCNGISYLCFTKNSKPTYNNLNKLSFTALRMFFKSLAMFINCVKSHLKLGRELSVVGSGSVPGDEGETERSPGHEAWQGEEQALPAHLDTRGRTGGRRVVLVGGVAVRHVEVEEVPLVDDLKLGGDESDTSQQHGPHRHPRRVEVLIIRSNT